MYTIGLFRFKKLKHYISDIMALELAINKTYDIRKLNGTLVPLNKSKITDKLAYLAKYPTKLTCNPSLVTEKIIDSIKDRTTTSEIDEMSARAAYDLWQIDIDFQKLAARIIIDNQRKRLFQKRVTSFSSSVAAAYTNLDTHGRPSPRVNQLFYKFVRHHAQALDSMPDYNRDFSMAYLSIQAMIDKYMIKMSGDHKQIQLRPQDYVIERPQDVWMRVACALHMNRLDIYDQSVLPKIKKTYEGLANGKIMLSTPIIYNAGTNFEQLISCFIIAARDSIDEDGGISDMMKKAQIISKYTGGIGAWFNLRCAGAEVKKVNGVSDGPENFIRLYESSMAACNQGGKRKGSGVLTLEPTHPYFERFTELPRTGQIQGLFYACMLPDAFMWAVRRDEEWYQFCPSVYPEIYESYGEKYERLYREGIAAKKYHSVVKARKLWLSMMTTVMETGKLFMVSKEAVNKKSNQKNLGIIHALNLCQEIAEVSTPDEYACCVLGTLCLPAFIKDGTDGTKYFDFEEFGDSVREQVRNLNKVIDINAYPVKETEAFNRRVRNLAIGTQGEADTYALLRIPYVSAAATKLCSEIYEALHYYSWDESCRMAEKYGAYDGFFPKGDRPGCPASRGEFQWTMWGVKESQLSGRFDWSELRSRVIEKGLYNSLLTALPPTATTSHIQGNNESFEPFVKMVFTRQLINGEFTIVNKHFVKHMQELGLWNETMVKQLLTGRGSIQAIETIPAHIREIYKTVHEYKGKDIIAMQRTRSRFIDQSCSNNQYMKNPTMEKLTSLIMDAWDFGSNDCFKTIMYYANLESDAEAQIFSTSAADVSSEFTSLDKKEEPLAPVMVCKFRPKNIGKDEECSVCSG